ncbi:E3 ubiquitin-protein ligase RHA1B-like [Punica granatum]|uniref:Uncharacterized protein n=2 Tax=Punica granatum TaxID=22663 RepID=A0A2I0I5F1_PUNGR|nr:E3 ubiquitin-protein ligase RHA1B-like [Punica granatum]PKI39208.1 hypothetical protein CRG98_040397 [Punica granatum]
MGFPVGYTEVFLPKLFLNALSFLGILRGLIASLFNFLGLSDFLEPDPVFLDPPHRSPDCPPVSALLIRELLPVDRFEDGADPPGSCAVCLYEFEAGEEIRRLRNCRHVFHRNCLDLWMDCDQMTCPLCRTQFVPDGMEEEFNQRLWAASGVAVNSGEGDFYCEYSSV